jgi:hypothetical protein
LKFQDHTWAKEHHIEVHSSDYSEDSVLSILDETSSKALVSFLSADSYLDLHKGWLEACIRSKSCKRLIPSEWAGNIDDYPLQPDFYATTREPFREILRKTDSSIEWTLVNCGWLMDYFLPEHLNPMPPEPEVFPVDPDKLSVSIRGTGEELQSWTWTTDLANAVVELMAATSWVCKLLLTSL